LNRMNSPPTNWIQRLMNAFPSRGSLGKTLQIHPHTQLDRYPRIFEACAEFAGAHGWEKWPDFSILSFGCSTGEEAHTLGKYFPTAKILAVDVNIESLKQARAKFGSPNIRFEKSGSGILRGRGPFHIVYCMSVLCAWPETRTMDDATSLFPFSRFEESLNDLHPHVRPGGLLVLYNTTYCFKDSRLYPQYRPLFTEATRESGYVHKFSPDGRKMEGFVYPEVIFEKT
jgi:hypothetical protein